MKKLVLIFLLILPFLSFGENPPPRTEGDCNSTHLVFISKNIKKISDMLPAETKSNNFTIVQNAYNNLKKYCNWDKKVLQTPFFLNHLVDQYFRYLDGIKTENYYGPLYPPSQNRRKYLNQIAENNFRGVNPEEVKNKYKNLYLKQIAPLYNKLCKKIEEINNFAESNPASSEDKNHTGKYEKLCINLANQQQIRENLLIVRILKTNYYTVFDTKSFKYFKAFASQRNNLYNLFTIALGDFYYLVNRFIKVTDANTK